jgi:hypothetical protein
MIYSPTPGTFREQKKKILGVCKWRLHRVSLKRNMERIWISTREVKILDSGNIKW